METRARIHPTRMSFIKPIFPIGLNTTCRRGLKWSELRTGDRLLLEDVSGERPCIRGDMRVVSVWHGPFLTMPQDLLDSNHDPDAASFDGLFHSMKRVYPDFQADEVVTVVQFRYRGAMEDPALDDRTYGGPEPLTAAAVQQPVREMEP